MSDKKITELTELLTLGDNDVLVVVDATTNPSVPVTKKIKTSTLRSQLLKSVIYADTKTLVANVETNFTFSNDIGTAVDGSDYILLINNHVVLTGEDSVLGFEITERTQSNVKVKSLDNSICELVVLKQR